MRCAVYALLGVGLVEAAQKRFWFGLDAEQEMNETSMKPPNIVWLMADDLGYGEVGFNYKGDESRRIDTPNLDKMAEEGMRFKQAYSGYTVCAPSRTTFFTGRHVGSFWKHGYDGENIAPSQGRHTLAVLLRQAGYHTGAFGKISPLTSPLHTGFDHFVGQVDQNFCHNMYPSFIDEGFGKFNKAVGNRDMVPSRDSCLSYPETFNYSIDIFHQEGVEWLESVVGTDKPFFLYMAYTVPHAGGWDDAPLDSTRGQPVPSLFHYEEKPWPSVEKDHAACITYLDTKVGQLMTRLKDLGVDDNTLVFFASDNGAHVEGGHSGDFFDSSGGLRGQKRSLFEGGVRSPTVARWPERISGGSVANHAWAFWDVLPTLLELAGASAPLGIDGESIVPTLLGKEQEAKEYLFFSWRTRTVSQGVPDDGPRLSFLQTGQVVQHPPKGTLGKRHDQKESGRNQKRKASLLAVAEGKEAPAMHKPTGVRLRQLSRALQVHKGKKAGKNTMAYAVRSGNWKGVVPNCKDFSPNLNDDMALFNLHDDPFEEEDIAEDNADVVQKLKEMIVSKDLSCGCFQCDWPPP